MNLQISVPYQKCVYSCPMCVAKAHRNEGTFENLYKTNKTEWYNKLNQTIYNGDYNSIVLTGECDPTQDMAYCEDVISVIDDHNPTPTVEFTTHNQKAVRTLLASYWGKKVDVVTLSVTNVREYLNAWRFPERNAFFSPIYRMVILLTKEFEFLNVNNFNTMGFDQITFKTLQHGEDASVNAWIDNNKMSEEGLVEIRKIVDKYNSHEGEINVYYYLGIDDGISDNSSLEVHDLIWCDIDKVEEKLTHERTKKMFIEVKDKIIDSIF